MNDNSGCFLAIAIGIFLCIGAFVIWVVEPWVLYGALILIAGYFTWIITIDIWSWMIGRIKKIRESKAEVIAELPSEYLPPSAEANDLPSQTIENPLRLPQRSYKKTRRHKSPTPAIRYQIISARNIRELEKTVLAAARAGWKPQGGVCAWSGGMLVMQAMIKEIP